MATIIKKDLWVEIKKSGVLFFSPFCFSYTTMIGNFCFTCKATIADTTDVHKLHLVEHLPLILLLGYPLSLASIVLLSVEDLLLCKHSVGLFCQIEIYLQYYCENKQSDVKIVLVHPADVKRCKCSLVRSHF